MWCHQAASMGHDQHWSCSSNLYLDSSQGSIFWSENNIYLPPSENDIFPPLETPFFKILMCPFCLNSSLFAFILPFYFLFSFSFPFPPFIFFPPNDMGKCFFKQSKVFYPHFFAAFQGRPQAEWVRISLCRILQRLARHLQAEKQVNITLQHSVGLTRNTDLCGEGSQRFVRLVQLSQQVQHL
jgi:hypothetical protein